MAELTVEYANIKAQLDQLAEDGVIDEFYKITIMDMSERVLANLAASYANIRKGVRSVMIGQVLDYEAKRILNEGIDKGREEGIFETLISLVQKGLLSIKDAAVQAGITEADFRQKMAAK